MPSLNVLTIGASKNIGYYSAIRFLNSGATVTFLLRDLSVFDADETIRQYVKSRKAQLFKGDALVENDLKGAWREAAKFGPVDLLLSSVGGTPSFSPTKGIVIKPANLVTQVMFNIMMTMPRTEPQPRFVAISTAGLTNTAYAALPLPLKPLYAYLLDVPRKDKEGAERVISHCAGWKWNTEKDGEPSDDIMGVDWRNRPGLLAPGSLKSVLVVRPPLLTDGECLAENTEKKGYRVSVDELKGYTVSRKDVAHFVVDAVLNKWSELETPLVHLNSPFLITTGIIIMSLNVLAIGASRNIGYYSAIRFLNSGATVTFLLRSPAAFDSDEVIQKYVKSGKARLIKGDALVEDDVQASWSEAVKCGPIDLLLCTVGGTPEFTFTKGFIIKPANLVTQALINALITMPQTQPQPRIITVSSIGLTKTSHAALPLLMKPLYGRFLEVPHRDKVGSERVIFHCAGWQWNTEDGEPGDDIMGTNWKQREGLPAPGSLKSVLVVRPALLTDGECRAENSKKAGYRASEDELGGYTVSRKDVAHFIADAVLNKWSEHENKVINIAY
ncbi:hypothetical protein CVT25_012812 [Psilocybe cyanescens]|uniref:NAD(P)-binding domain-containing protein n=1 Tax=Psilocybe cyanescens TaxID=93625 RepID=A0A409XF91_PSICY|nr:hypothetical protein CVT25_012812 [Psilocybe cyanescens]